MRLNRAFLQAGCLAAILWTSSCASTSQGESPVADLQAQMVELQKAQAGLNARIDEVNHALLVLEEAVRLNKDEIAKVSRNATTPRITIANPPDRPLPKSLAGPEPPGAPLAGQGGEFVAPPPGLDPVGKGLDRVAPPVFPKVEPKKTAGGGEPRIRLDPTADLLKDPGFRKAWENHKPGGYALSIYEWNDLAAGSKDPNVVAAARYYQADAYFQLKDQAQAIRLFQAIADDAQAGAYRAPAACRLAACLDAAGRLAEAKAQYRKVIEQFPGSDAATAAAERLKRLE
jgi:TolA-binding protein